MRRRAKGRDRIADTRRLLAPYLLEVDICPNEVEVANHPGRDGCHDIIVREERLFIYNYLTARLYFDGGERYELFAGVLDLGDGAKVAVSLPDWLRHEMRKMDI